MGKELELLFTVPVGMKLGLLGDHGNLIVDLSSHCIS